MNYYMPLRKPAVIQSMQQIERFYVLLQNRHSHLISRLHDDDRETPINILRKNELKLVDSQLAKMERFLRRYGYIAKGVKT